MYIHLGLKSKRFGVAMLIALAAASASLRAAEGGTTEKGSPDLSVNGDSDGKASAGNATGAETISAPDPASPFVVELQALKEAVQAQTRQFAEHSRELESERAALREELDAIERLEAKLGIPSSGTVNPASPAPQLAVVGPTASAGQQNVQNQEPINVVTVPNPFSIKIGGADFTPGGFVDLTGIFRSTNDGTSGLSTNLPAIPFNNTLPEGQLSEFRFTSQGSRLSLKVDANISHSTAATGYFESDFNGYEPANAEASTKSDTFRLRLAWAQIRHGKWEVLTGQSWSLLTPTRSGLSPASENIFTALRLDTSYLAGMVYSRQPGVRFTYHPNTWSAFAIALENPDQFVPSSVVFPTDGSTNFFLAQFDNGSSNTSATSASSNTAAPNLHPDIIAKAAFDSNLAGRALQVDIGGVARSFRDYSNLSTPHSTDTIVEGAGQVDVNFEVAKSFHLIGNSFYGEGGGRYLGALGPDVIVKPDGTLSPVRSGSAIFGYEWQATPKLIVDGYYSGAYFWRYYRTATSAVGSSCGSASTFCVGFGFPGSANTNNKDYQEATIGFVPTIWSSPNYGRLQFISQFSYVVRAPWYVPAGSPKNAHSFISFVNIRYILP
jgi:hypothetical protein